MPRVFPHFKDISKFHMKQAFYKNTEQALKQELPHF